MTSLDFDDSEALSKRLAKRAGDLFNASTPRVEALRLQRRDEYSESLVTQDLCSDDDVQTYLNSAGVDSDVFLIFRQSSSWGRFNVSQKMFQAVVAHVAPFEHFIRLFLALGFKLEEDLGLFSCCSRTWETEASPEHESKLSLEMIYHMQYPERHGRNLKNPWSIRHTAVYQRFDSKTQRSIWLVLQPSESMYQRLRSCISKGGLKQDAACRFSTNNVFFGGAERNWAEYIAYWQTVVTPVEEKALYSSVDKPREVDFVVAFKDCQNLARYSKEMSRCAGLLESSLDLLEGYRRLMQEASTTRQQAGIPERGVNLSYLSIHESNLKSHKRAVESLLDRIRSASQILNQILTYRHDGLLIASSVAVQKTSESIRAISSGTEDQAKLMAGVLHQSQIDAKTVKILTIVAMLYLPANLAASIFNTNLVQNDSDGLHVSKDFWVFPVLALGLLLVTVAGTFTNGWTWGKSPPAHLQQHVQAISP